MQVYDTHVWKCPINLNNGYLLINKLKKPWVFLICDWLNLGTLSPEMQRTDLFTVESTENTLQVSTGRCYHQQNSSFKAR